MTTNLIGRSCEFRDSIDGPWNGQGTIVAAYQRLPGQFVYFLIETTDVPAGRLLERQMEFVRMRPDIRMAMPNQSGKTMLFNGKEGE